MKKVLVMSVVLALALLAGCTEAKLTGIEVTAPTKVNYWQGEELDLTGASLELTFSDNKTEQLALTGEGVAVSGYDKDKLGEQTVTVSYKDFEDSFKVNVSEDEVSYSVTGFKAEYLYEGALDLSEGKLVATYLSGKTQDVADLDDADVEVTGFSGNQEGVQALNVKYNGKDVASFDVTVLFYNVIKEIETLAELTAAQANQADRQAWFIKADIGGIANQLKINKRVYLDGQEYTLTFIESWAGNATGLLVNGAGSFGTVIKNITLDRNKSDLKDWKSDYTLQVWNAKDIVLQDVALTGGVAGLYVNGSEVTVKGTIDVSGNGFGGIEVGDGANPAFDSKLTFAEGAEIINNTEAVDAPTVWMDKNGENKKGEIEGISLHEVNYAVKDQAYFYLDASNADGLNDPIDD